MRSQSLSNQPKKIDQIKEVTKTLQDLGVEYSVRVAVAAIMAEVPFLSWWIIPKIISASLKKLFIYLSTKGIILVNKTVISIEIDVDVKKVTEARDKAVAARKSGYKLSKGELDELDRQLDEAMDELIPIGRAPL